MADHEFELPNGFTYKGKLVRTGLMRELSPMDMAYLRDRKAVKKDIEDGWTPLDVVVRRNIVELGGISGDTLVATGEVDKATGRPTMVREVDVMYNEYLHLADSIFLLIEARRWGVSDKYVFETRCPECKGVLRPSLKLSDLEVEEQPEEFRGKTTYILPVKDAYGDEVGMVIEFCPVLAKHGATLRGIVEDFEHERPIQEALVQVQKVDGNAVSRDTIVTEWSWKQLAAVSFTMEQVSGGVNIMLDHKCHYKGCRQEVTIPMLIGNDFLSPGKHSSSPTGSAVPIPPSGTGKKCSTLGGRVLNSKVLATEN